MTIDSELSAEEAAFFASGGETAPTPTPIVPDTSAVTTTPAPAAPATAGGAGAPDPDVVDVGADGKVAAPGKYVPHGAFHQERLRRKELETQLAQLAEQRVREAAEQSAREARLAERVELLNKVLTPPAAEPPKPPSLEEDIYAYVRHLGQQLDQVANRTTQVATERAEDTAYTAMKTSFVADARSFATQTPDFPQAYQHVIRARDQQLQAIGYAEPAQRAEIINNDERAIVAQALQARRSPSAALYALAKTMGYAPAAPIAPAVAGGNGAAAPGAVANGAAGHPVPAPVGNGSSAPAVPAAPAVAANVAAEIARLQAGQDAARSLSGGGGVPANRIPSAAELASMTEAQFGALMKGLSEEQQARIMGGFEA